MPRERDGPLGERGEGRDGQAERNAAHLAAQEVEGGKRGETDDRGADLQRQVPQRKTENLDQRERPVELEGLPTRVANEEDRTLAVDEVEDVQELLGMIGLAGVAASR